MPIPWKAQSCREYKISKSYLIKNINLMLSKLQTVFKAFKLYRRAIGTKCTLNIPSHWIYTMMIRSTITFIFSQSTGKIK